jgi:hypothetical protein
MCVCLYVCVCVCMYVYMYLCIKLATRGSMRALLHVRDGVICISYGKVPTFCVYECVYTCMCVCMYSCISMHSRMLGQVARCYNLLVCMCTCVYNAYVCAEHDLTMMCNEHPQLENSLKIRVFRYACTQAGLCTHQGGTEPK